MTVKLSDYKGTTIEKAFNKAWSPQARAAAIAARKAKAGAKPDEDKDRAEKQRALDEWSKKYNAEHASEREQAKKAADEAVKRSKDPALVFEHHGVQFHQGMLDLGGMEKEYISKESAQHAKELADAVDAGHTIHGGAVGGTIRKVGENKYEDRSEGERHQFTGRAQLHSMIAMAEEDGRWPMGIKPKKESK